MLLLVEGLLPALREGADVCKGLEMVGYNSNYFEKDNDEEQ